MGGPRAAAVGWLRRRSRRGLGEVRQGLERLVHPRRRVAHRGLAVGWHGGADWLAEIAVVWSRRPLFARLDDGKIFFAEDDILIFHPADHHHAQFGPGTVEIARVPQRGAKTV